MHEGGIGPISTIGKSPHAWAWMRMIFSRKLPDIDDRAETGNGFLAINNCMNEV